jgi:hypothetical protein
MEGQDSYGRLSKKNKDLAVGAPVLVIRPKTVPRVPLEASKPPSVRSAASTSRKAGKAT